MSTHDSDPFDTVAQEEAAEETRSADRRSQERESDDLKWLMSSKQGRRFMWRLLSKAHISRSSFVAPNAMTVSFLEGERNIGAYFQGQVLNDCPNRYIEMIKEHQDVTRNRSI